MDATGRDPGSPRQTPQTRVFGAALVLGVQRQKALVGVLSWTWHSTPITGRKPCVALLLARAVLSTACSLAVITRRSIVHAFAAVGVAKHRSESMLRAAAATFYALLAVLWGFVETLECYGVR